MSSVLGVTAGTSAVRIVRPIDPDAPSAGYQFQVVETRRDDPARLAAQTVGVLVQAGIAGESVERAGLVYRDAAEAGRLRAAMAEQGLDRYSLVGESEAALTYLRATGELTADVAVLYDLGASGLTVTVADRSTGAVHTERTGSVAGRLFDDAVRLHLLGSDGVWRPDDPQDEEFVAQCRAAKEQLSGSDAVAVPGTAGVILMSLETFEPLITPLVEASARFVRDVVQRSGARPETIVLLGGGAHVRLVRRVLETWTKLPVVVPHEPELVLAKGGALRAVAAEPAVTELLVPPAVTERIVPPGGTAPHRTERLSRAESPAPAPSGETRTPRRKRAATAHEPHVSKRQISGAGLAGTALGVVAMIGLALGAQNTLAGDDESDIRQTEVIVTTPSPTPQPAPAVAPAPAPTTTTTVPPVEDSTTARVVPPPPPPTPAPPPLIPGLNIPVPTLPPLPPLPTIEVPPELRLPI
ncbi:Hsp70 family protein [Rhodococcus rhodochrous]|uniref:Chaperone protein n=1 Tax=Rhodococcus rhodochrous KG-21 TaxID=1441923 RepID=A0A0M9WMN5_RHORH|nr:Hsp70 family protein [Rhodococcus rhodochrous]KOS54723.1 chaperone protein [Rhodococcus rhodochrous KG-21]